MRLLRYSSNWISVLLSGLLLWGPGAATAQTEVIPTAIQITVIDGEGAINELAQRSTHDPVVEVQDQNKHPLAAAAVVFTLPTQGPSGEFGNGSKTLTVMTDEQGRAVASGLKVNRLAGKLLIHVNASYKGQTARIIVTQFNMASPSAKPGGGGSGKTIAILALIGAAVAGGVVAATQRGGHSSSPGSVPTNTPIGITPGTGTVGPPR